MSIWHTPYGALLVEASRAGPAAHLTVEMGIEVEGKSGGLGESSTLES
jgi:hypothetical protein